MYTNIDDYQEILQDSILCFFSDDQRNYLLKSAEFVDADAGFYSGRGVKPNDLFIHLQGEITLVARNGLEIGRSRPGRSFELGTLLMSGSEWQQIWRCDTRCKFLKISWGFVLSELGKNSDFLAYLQRVTSSIALQKLKRDMQALNLSKNAIIQIIGKMKLEPMEAVFSDWSRSFLLCIASGEINVSATLSNQKNLVAIFQTGDSCYLDLKNSSFVYEASPRGFVWTLDDKSWIQSSLSTEIESFIRIFRRENSKSDEGIFLEKTSVLREENGFFKKKVSLKSDLIENEKKYDEFLIPFGKKSIDQKIYIQADDMRSGAAILATLAHYFGIPASVAHFEKYFPLHSAARSMSSLGDAAVEFGFEKTIYHVEDMDEALRRGPVIAEFEQKFVIIFRKKKGFYIFGDSELGTLRKLQEQSFGSKLFSQEILLLQPTPRIRAQSDQKIELFSYISVMNSQKMTIFLFFCAGIISYTMSLSVPLLNQYIFDEVLPHGRKEILGGIIFITAALTCLSSLMEFSKTSFLSTLKTSVTAIITSIINAQIFKMPAGYFKRNGFSGVLGRLNEIEVVSSFISYNFLSLVLSIILSCFSFSVLYLYHPSFVFLIAGVVPLQFLILKFFEKKIHDAKTQMAIIKGRETSLIYQHFRSPDHTRSLGVQVVARWMFDKNSLNYELVSGRLAKFELFYQLFGQVNVEFLRICVIVVSGSMYVHGSMTLGKVMAISMMIPKVSSPIQQLFQGMLAYTGLRASLHRLDHFHFFKKELSHLYQEVKRSKIKGKIEFRQVDFKHEKIGKVKALKQINFTVYPGEFVVVVGPTGSGKSTLARLLGGLDFATFGEILFDDKEIHSYQLSQLRRELGFVEQDGSLFTGSFQSNIALGDIFPIHERVADAARIADLEDLILDSSQTYATDIGSVGASLSEGQRQRMLIARSIYADPSMLILDESTCHLDPITEEQVIHRLLNKFSGRTVIFFTQRVHLASRADRVFYLEDGQLIEQGSHKDLIKKQGKYFDFFCRHLSLG